MGWERGRGSEGGSQGALPSLDPGMQGALGSLGMLEVGRDPLEARRQQEGGCEEGEVPGGVQGLTHC